MNQKELDLWLKRTDHAGHYWHEVKHLAQLFGVDGCTGVAEFYRLSCLEHDLHYRFHTTIGGSRLTRKQADYIFKVRIQQMSCFGKYSPMAQWRWVGVRLLAQNAWEHD